MTDRISLRRTLGLARWNAVLLTRNRLAAVYAVVLPLLPLLLLLAGDRGAEATGAGAVVTMFLVTALFPVYYNVLAQFVNRRDELVLKRMRTGEVRDAELVASIALPGVLCALVLTALAVPIAAALGQSLPVNPLLYAVTAVLAVVMFTAFAYWTAAWTRSAEAAQLTSMPIIVLASLGPLASSMPEMSERLRDALSLTPGAAMADLVRIGWFGLDGPGADQATLSFAETWGQAGQPLAVMAVWAWIAITLARRSMRWEPRG
ncbi:MAG TPA: ABC transporter permease [Solirubrobacteraceae bacterium]|nr:ABC transporter permease [Solirubrobacteraceae bacterium]